MSEYIASRLAVALAEIEVSDDGCWTTTGTTRPDGYGVLSIHNRVTRKHRFVYEQLVGEIPLGLVLDHLCRNRACCNPAHLEPVTHRTNVLRGVSSFASKAKQTHCKHGHAFVGDNVYMHRGRRMCRTCLNETARRRRAGLAGAGTCSADGCSAPVNARNLCSTHYNRWYKARSA